MSSFKKYLYWGSLGLFVYMPFHIFLSQWLSTYTGGLEAWKIAKDFITAFLVAVTVGAVLLTRKYTRLYLVILGLASVYLALHLVLLVGTEQPVDTGLLATAYNNRLFWYLLIGYGLAILAPRMATPRRFATVLIAVSTVVAFIGFMQWVLPKDIMTYFGYSIERGVKPNFFIDDKPDLPRVFSTIRDPNSLGAFLILPSTITLLALVKFWYTKRRMLFGGLVLLHGLVVLMTFSRSAWIGLFIAHALAVLFVFRNKIGDIIMRYALPIAGVFLLVAFGAFLTRDQYIVQNVIFHSDESTTQDDPNELRVQFFQEGLEGVADNPEGNGPGTAGLVSTRLPDGLLTENYYLQIAYEVGLAGLLIFLAFLYLILSRLWRLRESLIVQALLASFMGVAFMNLLLHTWANEAVAAAWFLLTGVVLAHVREVKRRKAPKRRAGR